MKKKAAAVLLLLLCAVCAWVNRDGWGLNPFQSVMVGDVVQAVQDAEGHKTVTDDSGMRLLGLNEDGSIRYILVSSQQDDESGYYIIKNMAAGEDGTVYILDKISTDGEWTAKEAVKAVSSDGSSVELLYEKEYEEQVFSGDLLNLQYREGILYVMESSPEGLTAVDVQNPDQSLFFPYEDADQMFRECMLGPEGDLTVILQTGRILSLNEAGEAQVLYDRNQDSTERIPWAFSYGPDGTMYVTDIWNREICYLENGQLVPCLFGDEAVDADFTVTLEEAMEYCVYYQVDADYGLMTCNTESVGWMEGDTYQVFYEFPLSTSLMIRCILFWIAAAILAVALLAAVILGIRHVVVRGSKIARICTLAVVATVVLTLVTSLIVMKNIEERLSAEVLERANTMAELTAKTIPVDALLSLQDPEDYDSEAYETIRDVIQGDFTNTDGTLSDMYCVVYTLDQDVVMTRFMLEETSGSAYVNEWDSYAEQEVLESGQSDYYTTRTSDGFYAFALTPILDEDGNSVGLVEVGRDMNTLSEENAQLVRDIFMSVIALTVVLLMIGYELLMFLEGRNEYRNRKMLAKDAAHTPVSVDMLRLAVFIIFFLINISTGFMSIYATQLASTFAISWLPQSILAAIPISAEVLTGALFSVWGGIFIRKLGQRKAGILGGILFTLGLALRFIPNLWILTLGSAVQGCGWGIVLLIINVMIAEMDSNEVRQRGFTGYNIACQNGVNSGVVFGGFLLNWLNYRQVFLVSAVLSISVLLFVWAYFSNVFASKQEEAAAEESRIPFRKFISSPRVLLYLVGILFPVTAGGYYLNYLYPVIGEGLGIPDSYIGYSYLLNSLCIMFLGNMLTRLFTRYLKQKLSLIAASAIYAGTFLLVGLFPTVPVLLVALVLLGISDSFGLSIQASYFTNLPEVEQYGYEKSMGISNLVDNLAETAGSFLFGYVLVIGLKEGLVLMAALVVILALLFGIFGRGRKGTPRKAKEGAL